MFVELAEYLRCPEDPAESYCVVASDEMVGRSVIRGVIGCPATGREYRIEGGVADFTSRATSEPASLPVEPLPDARAVTALLGVATPGGYIVLFGSAARLAAQLHDLIGGIHMVGINVASDVEESPVLSLLRTPCPVALRSSMARGVVVGADHATEPWMSEACRILLKGLRIVVMRDVAVPGADRLGAGEGLWVGQKK